MTWEKRQSFTGKIKEVVVNRMTTSADE